MLKEMESNGTDWLATSLHAFDSNVKQLLKLIEDKNIQISNEDFKTEGQKRPDLVAYVEDLHTQYHLLAERYTQLVKEQGESVHVLDEDMGSPFYTPLSKFTEINTELQAIRLSDRSYKNGYGSSSTSLSDSDFENYNHELDGEKRVAQNGKENILIKRIEEYEIQLHDAERASWETEKKLLEAENKAKSEEIETLNKCAEALKLKNYMANARLDTLTAELSHKDNVIQQLNERISHLNSVNAELNVSIHNLGGNQNDSTMQLEVLASQRESALCKAISESDEFSKCIDNLRVRVSELEEELEEQKALVVEGAELKREAIRQLCMSMEYYRSENLELREVIGGKKRHTLTGDGSQGPSSS